MRILTKITVIAALLTFVLFSSCNNNEDLIPENEHLKNHIVSKVLTLNTSARNWTNEYEDEFSWLDPACEDVPGNPLEWNDFSIEKKKFTFENGVLHYAQDYETNMVGVSYDSYTYVSGLEYTKAMTIERNIDFSYKIQLMENGRCDCAISFNVFEPNYPLWQDPSGNEAFGKTFSGNQTYTTSWTWASNMDSDDGIMITDFPFPQIGVRASFDFDGNFKNNWISSFRFSLENMLFTADLLDDTTLALHTLNDDEGFYQLTDEEWEAIDVNGNPIDCESTYTMTTRTKDIMNMVFTIEE